MLGIVGRSWFPLSTALIQLIFGPPTSGRDFLYQQQECGTSCQYLIPQPMHASSHLWSWQLFSWKFLQFLEPKWDWILSLRSWFWFQLGWNFIIKTQHSAKVQIWRKKIKHKTSTNFLWKAKFKFPVCSNLHCTVDCNSFYIIKGVIKKEKGSRPFNSSLVPFWMMQKWKKFFEGIWCFFHFFYWKFFLCFLSFKRS